MGARENECQILQSYILHMKFSEFYLCFHNSCEICHSFSRTSKRIILRCYYRWLITSLALEKYEKECTILQIILVQSFCPLKITISQLPVGFRVNLDLKKFNLNLILTCNKYMLENLTQIAKLASWNKVLEFRFLNSHSLFLLHLAMLQG